MAFDKATGGLGGTKNLGQDGLLGEWIWPFQHRETVELRTNLKFACKARSAQAVQLPSENLRV